MFMVWIGYLFLLLQHVVSENVQWDSNHIRWDSELNKYVPDNHRVAEPHGRIPEKHEAKYHKDQQKHSSRGRHEDKDQVKNTDNVTLPLPDIYDEKKSVNGLNKLDDTLGKVKLGNRPAKQEGDQMDISANEYGNESVPSSSNLSMLNNLENIFASTNSASSPEVSSAKRYTDHEGGTSRNSNGMGHASSMAMTFSPFMEYKLVLLFDWLVIDSPFMFFITWLVVAAAAILMHGLKYANLLVESSIAGEKKNNSLFGNMYDNDHMLYGYNSYRYKKSSGGGTNNIMHLRSVHSLIGTMHYGLSLLLMLVAMTFNSALFVALITGYFIGDLLFYHLNPSVFDSDGASCH